MDENLFYERPLIENNDKFKEDHLSTQSSGNQKEDNQNAE